MISVLILYAFQDMVFEFFDQLRLLVGQDVFEGLDGLELALRVEKGGTTNLLNDSTAIHL